jgi:hypothetical protein
MQPQHCSVLGESCVPCIIVEVIKQQQRFNQNSFITAHMACHLKQKSGSATPASYDASGFIARPHVGTAATTQRQVTCACASLSGASSRATAANGRQKPLSSGSSSCCCRGYLTAVLSLNRRICKA